MSNPCEYGDPFCPCQDGDACHYRGHNPLPDPRPTIEQQIAELERAGWSATMTPTIWRSPTGRLYLGPHGAWKYMRQGGKLL